MLSAYCSMLSAQSTTKHYRVHFKVDEFQLDDADRTILDKLIAVYKQNRYCELNVSAHTDNDAGDAYNMQLSQNRAQSVIAYLSQNGISPKYIESGWYGERKPDASNRSEDGKSENRRVDVQLRTYNFTTVGELLRNVAPPSVQTFTVNSTEDTKITGRDGTIITIPKDALQTKSGKPVTSDHITVEMEEFLKPSDAAFHQLSTICEGRILETGGMFTIKAMADGEELELRKGKEMGVELPAVDTKPGMELFTAVKNPDGITEWQATSKPFVAPKTEKKKAPEPKLDLDFAALKKLLEKPDFSDNDKIEYVYKLPSFPVAPSKPHKPYKYREPERSNMYSWVERLVLPDSYMDRKVAETRERLEKEYQERLAKFEPKWQRYVASYTKYQRDSAAFEKEHGEPFHEWLVAQKSYHENFINAADQDRCNKRILKLIAMNDSNEYFKVHEEYKWTASANRSASLANRNRIALAYINMMLNWTLLETIEFNKVQLKPKDNELSLTKVPRKGGIKDYYVQYYNKNTVFEYYDPRENSKNAELNRLLAAAQRAATEKQVKAGVVNDQTIQYVYASKLNRFGSYNCDRFSETPPSMMASISVECPGDARVSFFVPSINGYIYANRSGNNYTIRLPKNAQVKLVCVTFSESEGLMCSVEPMKFSGNQKVKPGLKNVKLNEMNTMLASL
jgi:hypothetical protein